MGLRFYLGASGAGKSTTAYHHVIERAGKHPERRYYIIVPDQYTMITQKTLVKLHPDHGILNIDVLSFGRLAHRVMEEFGLSHMPLLDDTGKNLILRKLSAEHAEDLPYLGKRLEKTGYIHEVKSVISECMQYGLTPETVTKMAEQSTGKGLLSLKLQEISKLYTWFLAYIDQAYLTKEEILDKLTVYLPKSSLMKDAEVLFDGFTGFTPLQLRVVQCTMELCKQTDIVLTIPAEENAYKIEDEQELFYLTKKTILSLCKLQEQAGIRKDEDIVLAGAPVRRYQGRPELSFLEQHLFRNVGKSYDAPCEALSIQHMDTPREEVRFILRRLLMMVREEGYLYRDFGIVVGDLSVYGDLFREEAGVLGVPLFVDQNAGLLLNPFTEFIRSALQLKLQGFSYASVFHYLRSGLSEVTREEADQLEAYIIGLNIQGKKRYEEPFVRYLKQHKKDADVLQMLNGIREKFVDEIHVLYPEEEPKTMGEKIRTLYQFLQKVRAEQKCRQMSLQFAAAGAYAREKEYGAVYRLIMELLEQMDVLLGTQELSWKEFYEIFDAGLSELQAGSIPQAVDTIVCGDIERTRLDGIRVLFFAGVNDGNIPKGTGGGGLISDYDRAFLGAQGYEMAPSPKEQMFIQRLYLYMLLTKPGEHVYMSYAHVGLDGKTMQPAYLIRMLKKLFPQLKEQYLGTEDEIAMAGSAKDLLRMTAGMVGQYAGGLFDAKEKEKQETQTLVAMLKDDLGCGESIHRMLSFAFMELRNPALSKLVAESIYGTRLEASVTQLEKYAACEYAYFLRYGLGLQEKEEFELRSLDIGTAYHEILRRFGEALQSEQLTWFSYAEEDGERILDRIMEEYSLEFMNTILHSSARNEAAYRAMRQVMQKSIATLTYQMREGYFAPDAYELAFSQVPDLASVSFALSEREKVHLRGSIDRVDTYETEDKIYVKVMDYKSSDRKFDIVSVYHGLSLQLVIYMGVAKEVQEKKHPGKEVIPAGILYYHLQSPLATSDHLTMDENAIDAAIHKEMRTQGLILGDKETATYFDKAIEEKGTSDVIPVEIKVSGEISELRSKLISLQEFDIISNYVNTKIKKLSSDILSGQIRRNPYTQDKKDACTHCEYKDACAYDETLWDRPKREIGSEGFAEILQKMQEEGEEAKA